MEGPLPDPATLDDEGDDDVVCLYNYIWDGTLRLTFISATQRGSGEG